MIVVDRKGDMAAVLTTASWMSLLHALPPANENADPFGKVTADAWTYVIAQSLSPEQVRLHKASAIEFAALFGHLSDVDLISRIQREQGQFMNDDGTMNVTIWPLV